MIGEQLGAYRILDKLGEGGIGEVYRARDTRLGRTVAIKMLASSVAGDAERREQFIREARAAAALSHPNIAALYEVGEDEGRLYLAFEFVRGETLRATMAGRPLNPRRAVDLAIQIADALADAHAAGVIHRDIKPDNILITAKGNAKILDFGLATWTTGGATRSQAPAIIPTAVAATTLGTFAYMSPEQALGESVDERTDIFSLGVVLFEMLTGRLPFSGATAGALALQIVQAPAPAPSAINPSVPKELDPIVAKALAKSLDHRCESAATLAAELRSIAAILDVRSGTSEPRQHVAVVPARRSPVKTIVALVAVGGLLTAGWFERGAVERLWRRNVGSPAATAIAVVPLDLAEHDTSDTYFADGLTEDLITRLGQTPGLEVLGRSSTRASRNRAPRDVAAELGAGVVLTGSVGLSGDTVKVALALLDPQDGTAVWSNQYVRDLQDIFKVQAQAAEEVAAALHVKLQPTAASARTASRLVEPRAYEQYLRGRQAMDAHRIPDAIGLYQNAIAADAGLAEAHAGVAEATHLEMLAGQRSAAIAEQLKTAAERAYQLDPDLPQANLAMGFTSPTLREALQYMRHAVEIDPSYSDGYRQIADQIAVFDPEQSTGFYRKSLALVPANDTTHIALVAVLRSLDRFEEARREAEAVRTARFTESKAVVLTLIDLEDHKVDAALQALEAIPTLRDTAAGWSTYVAALVAAGRTDAAAREAASGAAKLRDSCLLRAMAAGLRSKGPRSGRAGDPAWRAAAAEVSTPQEARCAATMAFAARDARVAAALIDRIGANEEWLRYWALPLDGMSGADLLRGRTYPSSELVNDPQIAAARTRLDAAYARERDVARSVLSGLR